MGFILTPGEVLLEMIILYYTNIFRFFLFIHFHGITVYIHRYTDNFFPRNINNENIIIIVNIHGITVHFISLGVDGIQVLGAGPRQTIRFNLENVLTLPIQHPRII